MKTFQAKKKDINFKWYVVDLDNKILGRAASKIANVLRGKTKPLFTPHVDTGDFVVAINASKIALTGNKLERKEYYWHTGYPGGIKSVTAEKLLRTKPERILEEAVKGMLPKNILGKALLKKLKIYAGAEHPHKAQMPQELKI